MRIPFNLIVPLMVLVAWVPYLPAQEQTNDLDKLISQLYQKPWIGAEIIGESPTMWDFGLTDPMRKILNIGNPAEDALLDRIGDAAITDQVIFLLGGVSDETVIEPIIGAMVGKDLERTAKGKRINRAANLALTNITVADVIWHHGGGVVVERCQGHQKECWQEWWKRNRATFSINTIKQSRHYSNYPNYGIYRNKEQGRVFFR
jgi:hypothetical protein